MVLQDQARFAAGEQWQIVKKVIALGEIDDDQIGAVEEIPN